MGAGLSAAVEHFQNLARIAQVGARLLDGQAELRERARRGLRDVSRLPLYRREAEIG